MEITQTEEMTPSEAGQILATEPASGWMSMEQKKAMIEEMEAFLAGGGSEEDFAASKDLSKWSLRRYAKQVKNNARKSLSGQRYSAAEQIEKLALIKQLSGEGMPLSKAVMKAGITTGSYYSWVKKHSPTRRIESRSISSEPQTDTKDYNKPLRARIASLEKLVLELSMDKQALIEKLEGAI